jgi:hypothetical protein
LQRGGNGGDGNVERNRLSSAKTSPKGALVFTGGVIAQLGERMNGIHEVGGSIPPGSTTGR